MNFKKLTQRLFFFSIWSHRPFFINSVLALDQHWVHPKFFTIRFCNTISIVATDCILHGRFFWADSGKENVKVCLWNEPKFLRYNLLPVDFLTQLPSITRVLIAVYDFPHFLKWWFLAQRFFTVIKFVKFFLSGVYNAIILERLE